MILAGILDISINLITVFLILLALLMILVVFIQRPKQEGLGVAFGAALTDQAFGARTSDVMSKATAYFGAFLFVGCFLLGVLMQRNYNSEHKSSMLSRQNIEPVKTPDDLIKQLQNAEKAAPTPAEAPQTPAAPATPEVPAPVAPVTPEAPAAPATPADAQPAPAPAAPAAPADEKPAATPAA